MRAFFISGGIHMFAIPAILIGVVGIFYVRLPIEYGVIEGDH